MPDPIVYCTVICGYEWTPPRYHGLAEAKAICLLGPGHAGPHEGPHRCCWAWSPAATIVDDDKEETDGI